MRIQFLQVLGESGTATTEQLLIRRSEIFNSSNFGVERGQCVRSSYYVQVYLNKSC